MIDINCSLHGWSISEFILPKMGKGNCAWFEYDGIEAKFNGKFIVGTREEFLSYLKERNVPLYRPISDGRLGWVPYGLYIVKLQDKLFKYGEAKGPGSGYVASEVDFFPLGYAFSGETDYAKLLAFVGSNPYKTACSLAGVELPRYYKNFDKEEDNMFFTRHALTAQTA